MGRAARRFQRAVREVSTGTLNLGPRGALPIGTANYTIPGGAKYVDSTGGSNSNTGTIGSPYATVAYAVTQVAANDTIVCREGTYHEQFSHPSGNQPCTVMNYPGEVVWFDGSVVVSSWTQSGATWVHTGIPTQFNHSTSKGWATYNGNMLQGDLYAGLSDQVFYDGQPLTQIADATTPAAGQFSVNYGNNTITIGSNPSGHEVRVSDLKHLVVASQKISWKGVGVRRYSPDDLSPSGVPNSVGAPFYYGGVSGGSLFENVIIKQSAMAAANLNKPNITVRNCTVEENMIAGIGGAFCDGIMIDSCIIQNNNVGKFQAQPVAGAIKITDCNVATVINCLIADNDDAMGIWFDVSCVRVNILNNFVTGAHYDGITYEECDGGNLGGTQYRSIIAGNYVTGARYGLECLASGYADIYNNTLINCTTADIMMQQDRVFNTANRTRTLQECPWDTVHNAVVNNIMGPGVVIPIRIFDSFNNRDATTMANELRNNLITKLSGGIVQWGDANKLYTTYNTPATLQAAVPSLTSGNVQSATINHSQALGLPTSVASALGVATGTKQMGAFISS